MKDSPEYQTWKNIKRRTRPLARFHKDYYDRGIGVCEGFLLFDNFLKVARQRPTSKHTIDRTNNNIGYTCGRCKECRLKSWPENVRWATRSEQLMNTRLIRANNTSGYRGVRFNGKGWQARIRVNNKELHIGMFKTAVEAAQARDKAARRLHGSFAVLNFPNT